VAAPLNVLVDTGALFALLDHQDSWHARMRDWLMRASAAILVPMTVIQETALLVESRLGPAREAEFLRLAAGGAFDIRPGGEDLARSADLVDAYADFPLGFVDASIVAIAERLDIRDLLTTDRRHFGAVRPAHCERLRLLP
jgi:predicted nucleic acid-binding protein